MAPTSRCLLSTRSQAQHLVGKQRVSRVRPTRSLTLTVLDLKSRPNHGGSRKLPVGAHEKMEVKALSENKSFRTRSLNLASLGRRCSSSVRIFQFGFYPPTHRLIYVAARVEHHMLHNILSHDNIEIRYSTAPISVDVDTSCVHETDTFPVSVSLEKVTTNTNTTNGDTTNVRPP